MHSERSLPSPSRNDKNLRIVGRRGDPRLYGPSVTAPLLHNDAGAGAHRKLNRPVS